MCSDQKCWSARAPTQKFVSTFSTLEVPNKGGNNEKRTVDGQTRAHDVTTTTTHKTQTPSEPLRSVSWLVDQMRGNPTRLLDDQTKTRNMRRVAKLNVRDAETISKYLPSNVVTLFPTLHAPNDFFQPPLWLTLSVRLLNGAAMSVPEKPPFEFDTGDEAMRKNLELLREFDYDLDAISKHYANSTIGYGMEFRPVPDLEKIYRKHPSWNKMKTYMTEGVSFHFDWELTEADRKEDLELAMEYGNHKSAASNEVEVRRLLEKEVLHGFALPIPLDSLVELPGALLQPMGAAKQATLGPTGERIEKTRLTHDSSFNFTKTKRSINDRIDQDAYNELIYGFCLSRILHFMVALRLEFPNKTIFTAKFDYADAYRRLHHNGRTAMMQIIALGKMALIMLRLAFGGTPNPAGWTTISEMVTDLANEILIDTRWDPTKTYPPGRETVPPPIRNSKAKDIRPARELVYDIPTNVPARTDDFVDDLINTCIDDDKWLERSGKCIPLAVHVTSRPYEGDKEPIKRRPNLSPEKLAAEGTHAEVQMVLGWELDGRALELRLPTDKFLAWSQDMKVATNQRKMTIKALESLLGRLNHAAFTLPLSRHFLSRLRDKVDPKRRKWGRTNLSDSDVNDLEQFMLFLERAHRGISINLLVHRKPGGIGVSDSCPVGLGGFLVHTGRGWRLKIPPGTNIRKGSAANNVLEFLALAITIWLMCDDAKEGSYECLLSLADNTSALGWMYKAGRLKPDSPYFEAVQLIARKIATLTYEADVCLCRQHIKGKENFIADLLSFEGNERVEGTCPLTADCPDNVTLTQRVHKYFPQMIPPGFQISPLEPEKLSWIVQVLRTLESSMTPDVSPPTRPKIDGGADTSTSSSSWTLINKRSIVYLHKRKRSSEKLSLKPAELGNLTAAEGWLEGVVSRWQATQSEVPQAQWLRRYGAVSGSAPFTTKEGNLHQHWES